MNSATLRGALAAIALSLTASATLAQPMAPDPAHSADRQRMHEMMQQHRAAMAQDLRTILKLRPDQEAAFAAFQSSTTPPPYDHMKGDRDKMAAMTTPQKLDMMQARMDERMSRMRAHIQATKAFYAALSPEQQQVFDALMRMHGMHRGGHMHGGWGGHGGPMGGPGEAPPPPPGL